ncbi:MAG: hypothetical protein J6X19_06665 [Clostridia bacterium]|nr:hypothetical protein [Clostridia bacterium]MBP5730869.1 hypothetical protein [Clostridia bacterium]
MENRRGKIIVSKAGGTAGAGSKTYKLTLPSSWVSALGLTNRQNVVLSFDGEAITVRPVQSMKQYLEYRRSQKHEMLIIKYYNATELCTLIYADQTAKDLMAENYTDRLLKTAFGNKPYPTWQDLESFLEERCVPRQRDGLNAYLNALGLEEYEPLDIVRKTKGRMAEDDQWLEVEMAK